MCPEEGWGYGGSQAEKNAALLVASKYALHIISKCLALRQLDFPKHPLESPSRYLYRMALAWKHTNFTQPAAMS